MYVSGGERREEEGRRVRDGKDGAGKGSRDGTS
jgi:hypothetical protein